MVAVVSPAVSPCAEPSRKLLHLRYKPHRHIETHYMQRTHLLPSVLIATVCPGHFAEASVMCFDMVPQNTWYSIMHFVVNHSGTVSHLLILLSVFSPQRSSQTPPVRPISCTPALTLVALRRIKQKTLECLVPGSGSLVLLTARSTWTLPDHYPQLYEHRLTGISTMLVGNPASWAGALSEVIEVESS